MTFQSPLSLRAWSFCSSVVCTMLRSRLEELGGCLPRVGKRGIAKDFAGGLSMADSGRIAVVQGRRCLEQQQNSLGLPPEKRERLGEDHDHGFSMIHKGKETLCCAFFIRRCKKSLIEVKKSTHYCFLTISSSLRYTYNKEEKSLWSLDCFRGLCALQTCFTSTTGDLESSAQKAIMVSHSQIIKSTCGSQE